MDAIFLEILSIATMIIIGLAVISFIGVGLRLFGSFRQTRKLQTLVISIGFLIGAIGMLFLVGEHLIMTTGHEESEELADLADPEVSAQAYFIATLAVLFSIIKIYCYDLFALSFFTENRGKVLLISAPFLVLLLIYYILWIWTGLPEGSGYWEFNDDANLWDIDRSGEHEGLLFLIMSVPLFLSPLVMFYGGYRVRARAPLMKRMILLSFGQLIATFVYALEILEPAPEIMVVARLGWVFFPLWMYIWFTLPDFAKKWINWEG